MARIVKRLRNGPYSVIVDGQNKAFCGCGRSGTAPYCDGTQGSSSRAGNPFHQEQRKSP